jgi:hypothetical protein
LEFSLRKVGKPNLIHFRAIVRSTDIMSTSQTASESDRMNQTLSQRTKTRKNRIPEVTYDCPLDVLKKIQEEQPPDYVREGMDHS